jgi:hypothetical protein
MTIAAREAITMIDDHSSRQPGRRAMALRVVWDVNGALDVVANCHDSGVRNPVGWITFGGLDRTRWRAWARAKGLSMISPQIFH